MKGYLRLKMAYLPKQDGHDEDAGDVREEAEVGFLATIKNKTIAHLKWSKMLFSTFVVKNRSN